MHILRSLTSLLLLLSLSLTVHADTQAAQDLDSLLKNLRSFQANFTQIIRAGDDRILQQSSGTMALQRPGKFRWVVEQPNKQLIIANNKKLWVYDEDLAQVTVQSVATSQSTPAFLLSNDNQAIITKFAVNRLNSKQATVSRFLLQPKKQDNLFTSLQLVFKQNSLQQLVMTDGMGQITTITFNQVQINPTLPAKLFNFRPPTGVDIINNQ